MKNFLRNKYLLKVTLFIFLFLIFLQFSLDPDFGWHLEMGKKFVLTGEILRTDIYSWTMPGYSWGNSYFLYQAFVAFLYQYFGYYLLAVLFAMIAAVAAFLLIGKLDFLRVVAIVIGAKLAITNLAVRPQNISLLFFAVLILLLDKRFFTRRMHVLFWFLFFALWANVHRAFVVGVGVFSVFLIVDYLYNRSFGKKINVVVPLFCVLAGVFGSFLTPFSLDLYKSGIAGDFLTFENLNYISEWQSIVLLFPNNLYMLSTGIIYVYIFLAEAKKLGPAWFLIAAFLFSLAFVSANFVFFWCALFIFVSSKYLDVNLKNRFAKGALFIVGLGFLIYVSYTIYSEIRANIGGNLEKTFMESGYPIEAVKYMRTNSMNKNLLALYNWGGFLVWQYPEAKLFIDGRMAGWKTNEGRSILGIYMDIKSGKCASLETYKVETLLVSKAFNLSCFSNFREVYRDDVAKVLVKREGGI